MSHPSTMEVALDTSWAKLDTRGSLWSRQRSAGACPAEHPLLQVSPCTVTVKLRRGWIGATRRDQVSPSLPGGRELQPLNGPVPAPTVHVQNTPWLPGLTRLCSPHCPLPTLALYQGARKKRKNNKSAFLPAELFVPQQPH